MTDRHKTFGVVRVDPNELDPVTFELAGETFECQRLMPGAQLLRFVKEADSKDGGRSANALLGFIEQTLVEGDRERLTKVIDDPRNAIPVETLGEICGWLVEVYSERPTSRPSVSSATSSSTSPTSTAAV